MLAMLDHEKTILKYCLYSRKSTESDERQTMSIDSQIREINKNIASPTRALLVRQ